MQQVQLVYYVSQFVVDSQYTLKSSSVACWQQVFAAISAVDAMAAANALTAHVVLTKGNHSLLEHLTGTWKGIPVIHPFWRESVKEDVSEVSSHSRACHGHLE
jgi:hypothetical protein